MKTIKYLIFCTLFAVLFIQCNNKICSVNENVVIIFKNFSEDVGKTAYKGLRRETPVNISYLDGDLQSQYYQISIDKDFDTLIIPMRGNRIEIRHYYKTIEDFYYLLYAGDTVIFTYPEKIPYAALKNNKTKRFLNYDKMIREKVYNNDIATPFKYSVPILFHYKEISLSRNVEKTIDSLKKQYIPLITREYETIANYADSLYADKILSEEEYQYRKNSIIGKIYSMINVDSGFKTPFLLSYISDTIKFNNDSLLHYAYYQSYLGSKINKRLKGVKKIEGDNSRYNNNIAYFDTICNLGFLSEKEKAYFLRNQILQMQIAKYFSSSEKQLYFNKYIEITGDTATINQLTKIEKPDFSSADKLMLETSGGGNTDWQTVLNKHKGKLIYVDFWASWCGPCRQAMSAAKKLCGEYKGEDLVFVYLSFDDEKEEWQKAMDHFDLNRTESYIITNTKTSRFIKDLKVNSIPRYMLHNKEGELVYPNAPGPDSNEIHKLLDKYLSE
jgi:thiol-disulfide isomerase/thioredoxin